MNMKSLKYLAVVGVMAVSQVDAQNVSTYAGVQYTDSGRFLGTADNPKNTELYSRPMESPLITTVVFGLVTNTTSCC